MNKGHITESFAKKPKPSSRKGFLSKKTKFTRNLIKEVAGLAPYEKRLTELIRNSNDKKAKKFAVKRLGTSSRGLKKIIEISKIVAESRKH